MVVNNRRTPPLRILNGEGVYVASFSCKDRLTLMTLQGFEKTICVNFHCAV